MKKKKNQFIQKMIAYSICFIICMQRIGMPLQAYAAEKEKVTASIDNSFLSEDLYDIGYSFFKPEAVKGDSTLTVYFRKLGNIKYNGLTITPEQEAIYSNDKGPDWDAYTLPYTTGKTTYNFRIYSKIITSYSWNVTLTIAKDGTIVSDSEADTGEEEELQDGTYVVPISVIQATSSSVSMLDQYTYDTAELTIKDSVYTLTMYINHWYDEAAGTQAVSYMTYQGTNLTKVSSAKTIDSALYDTFTVDLADLSGTYTMTAMVIPMENITAGFGTQSVRVVLDLSEIDGISSSSGTTTDETAIARAQLGTLLDATAVLLESTYTSASWSALQTAILTAKVYYNNTSATQAQLTAQITAVQEAIAGLIKSSSSTTAGLEDGTYTIKVSAIKATSSDTSMANQYLKKTADLEVEDDIYKLTVYFKADEMNYLKYNGSKATMKSGSSYDGFTFTLANTEEYQTISVSVKQMEAINASLAVQSCRLVLDWDSVTSDGTTEEETTEAATEETETITATEALMANTTNTSSGAGSRKNSNTNAAASDEATIAELQTPLNSTMQLPNIANIKTEPKYLLSKASSAGVILASILAGVIALGSSILGGFTAFICYKRKYQK